MASSFVLILFSLFLAVSGEFGNVFQSEILQANSSFNGLGKCGEDLKRMVTDPSSWALKMLDATSKIRTGFALFSDDIGQFDECVNAASDDGTINGKYCLGSITISLQDQHLKHLHNLKQSLKENVGKLTRGSAFAHPFTWAACLPSSCSSKDFETLFNTVLEKTKVLKLQFDESKCSTITDDTKLTTGAIITIVFLSLMCLQLVVSTCYDVYCRHFHKVPNQFLLAFSMYTNSEKLFTMSKSNSQLGCLNGLKFYSMLWVVLGHTYSLALTGPMANFLDVLSWGDKLYSMLFTSGTLSVDTFFVVGGALVTYVYMQSMEKGKKFNVIIYYFHRYVRLTPALAVLVLVVATLFPYFGSGPYWMNVRAGQKMCQDVWWANLLYIQNYYVDKGVCAGHSWYLAVDMQLYILSPAILYSLKRFPKYTLLGLTAVILAICGADFGLAWSNHYLGILSNVLGDNSDYMSNFYIKTHTRANVWLAGVMVGYVIHQMKQQNLNLPRNKALILGIWIFCLVSMIICIFIGHDSLRTAVYQQWGNSLHIAFWRLSWSIGICWIMVACISGNGGPINWFLSLPVYQVFNRFAYSIYLVHYMMVTLWISSIRSPIFFSDLMMGYFFWGNLCFTCIISYFWVLAFESPVIILEKLILAPLMK